MKIVFVKALTSICTAGKERVLWALLLRNTEWSSFRGGKGAVFLGQEDLNFLFIAAMKFWAGRQAGWLTKRGL